MNTHVHRQMDWKRLTVEPHKQVRRCHSRDIYGKLQPMDEPHQEWPLWLKLLTTAAAIGAVWVWIDWIGGLV